MSCQLNYSIFYLRCKITIIPLTLLLDTPPKEKKELWQKKKKKTSISRNIETIKYLMWYVECSNINQTEQRQSRTKTIDGHVHNYHDCYAYIWTIIFDKHVFQNIWNMIHILLKLIILVLYSVIIPIYSNQLTLLNLIAIPPSLTHSHWFNLFQTICNSVEIGSTKWRCGWGIWPHQTN